MANWGSSQECKVGLIFEKPNNVTHHINRIKEKFYIIIDPKQHWKNWTSMHNKNSQQTRNRVWLLQFLAGYL